MLDSEDFRGWSEDSRSQGTAVTWPDRQGLAQIRCDVRAPPPRRLIPSSAPPQPPSLTQMVGPGSARPSGAQSARWGPPAFGLLRVLLAQTPRSPLLLPAAHLPLLSASGRRRLEEGDQHRASGGQLCGWAMPGPGTFWPAGNGPHPGQQRDENLQSWCKVTEQASSSSCPLMSCWAHQSQSIPWWDLSRCVVYACVRVHG